MGNQGANIVYEGEGGRPFRQPAMRIDDKRTGNAYCHKARYLKAPSIVGRVSNSKNYIEL